VKRIHLLITEEFRNKRRRYFSFRNAEPIAIMASTTIQDINQQKYLWMNGEAFN
jgi:hypothetical protein